MALRGGLSTMDLVKGRMPTQDPNAMPNDGAADIWANSKSSKEDMLFQKVWRQMAAQAGNAGLTEEQAWEQYNAAGRPRGHDTTVWMQGVTAPSNAVKNTTVTADPNALADVRNAAGLNEGLGADQVATLGGPDPVQQAIDQLRGADTTSAQQQQAALAGLQGAGAGFGAGQEDLVKQLQLAAKGEGPSAALALFQLALGKNIAGMNAAASGVRGTNAAAASRNAGLAGADLAAQSQTTAAALKAQEQQAAQALLGTTLAQGRQGDIARASAAAEIAGQIRGQDINKEAVAAGLVAANAQLEQQKQEARTGTALQLLQTGLGVQQTNIGNELNKAGLTAQIQQGNNQLNLGYDQLQQQKQQANRNFVMQLLGTILGGVGAAGAFIPGGGGGGARSAVSKASSMAPPAPGTSPIGWGTGPEANL